MANWPFKFLADAVRLHEQAKLSGVERHDVGVVVPGADFTDG